ncbi:MAG: DnaB-like helicase C-terminal domain-containing protein [bacterium]
MVNFNNNINQSRSMLKTFISKFASDELLSSIINLSLYPANFPYSSSINIIEYINTFLTNVNKTSQKLNFANYKQIRNHINVTSSILTIRDSGSIINYDNVLQHMNIQDLSSKKLIEKTIENKIDDDQEFKKLTNEVVNTINAFYEVQSIQGNILKYDVLVDSMNSLDMPIFEFLKRYKDTVIDSFNELSKLTTLNKEDDKVDNTILLKDENSAKSFAKTLVKYFKESYTYYETGFELIDNFIGGFESSSVHIVSAASNHGKSLLMINLCKNIIESNIDEFKSGDEAVLFITLEDDSNKLSRRFLSVFGNYEAKTIKNLYKESYLKCKETENDPIVIKKIEEKLTEITIGSIISYTKSKVNLIIRHAEENTFTPNDLSKMIDGLKAEGINVKTVFLDYIDVMAPTMSSGYKTENEYHAHGQIVHELRTLARRHSLPIITATQNSRASENITKALTNDLIGDSYKKVRYADFIYMMRMYKEKTFLDAEVRKFVLPKTENQPDEYVSPEYLKIQNELKNNLVPVQIVITKSKDDGSGAKRFCLFCKQNLKIYDTIDQYMKDAPIIKKNTKKLEADMDILFNTDMPDDNTLLDLNDDMFSDINIFNDSDEYSQ